MKHILFVDESGDHSLSTVDPNFPIFSLLGVLADQDSYLQLCNDINQFKINYFNTKDVILHSRDIRKCDGPFSILFDLELKKKFYEDLNKILSENKYVVVASAIRKKKHIEQYGRLADDPYEISLTFVMERMLFELDARRYNDEVTDVIIESRGKKEDQQLAKRYNELIYIGGGQVDPVRFRNKFCEELIFKRKRDNDIGLQIADLCAYPVARNILYPNEPYPSYEIIKPKIRNLNGKIEGYGIKVFP